MDYLEQLREGLSCNSELHSHLRGTYQIHSVEKMSLGRKTKFFFGQQYT